jgi:hypothetical protein
MFNKDAENVTLLQLVIVSFFVSFYFPILLFEEPMPGFLIQELSCR